jgi:hypothetical protein
MTPRVYHMNRFVQFFYCAIGLGLIGSAVFLLFQLGFQMGFWMILIPLPLSLAGIYCCRWAICSRLTLTETEISVRYAFGEDFAQLSEIEGWRRKSGPYWVLQVRNNSGSLSVNQNFAVDDVFLDFLSKLRNLNEVEMSVVP